MIHIYKMLDVSYGVIWAIDLNLSFVSIVPLQYVSAPIYNIYINCFRTAIFNQYVVTKFI